MSAALRSSVHEATSYEVLVAPPGVDQAAEAATAYRRLRGHGKELHVITRSSVLTHRIRTLMPFESRGDTVMTFAAYCRDTWRAALSVPVQKVDDHNVDLWEFRQRLGARYVRPLNRRHVVVVHGQQLPIEFFAVLRLLGIAATVFIDPMQPVDESGTPLNELVTVLGAQIPTTLRDSSDSTRQIREFLGHFEGHFHINAPCRNGPRPMLVGHDDVDEEIRFIVDHATNHPEAQIGILLLTQELVQVYRTEIEELFDGATQWYLANHVVPRHAWVTASEPGIKVLTWASAIGMRFDHVVLAALENLASQERFENYLQILGSTARDELVLSYSGAGRPTALRGLPADLLDNRVEKQTDSGWLDLTLPVTQVPVDDPAGFEPAPPAANDEAMSAARSLIGTKLTSNARAKRVLTTIEEVGLALLMRSVGIGLTDELPRGFRSTVRDNDERARAFDVMVLHNMGLVGSSVSRYVGAGLDFEDLQQHGVLGLMRAIEKWDGSRGLKFSTYATNWINQAMSRAIADEGTTIRLPVHMYETVRKVQAIRSKLQRENDDCSIAQIAKRADLSPEQVVKCLRLAAGVISIDAPLGADGEITFAELIPIPFEHHANPDYVVERTLSVELVRKAMSLLNEREAKVLKLRFGFDGGDELTLEKVGEYFSFTRERARQIESKAKKSLVAKFAEVGIVADDSEPYLPAQTTRSQTPAAVGRSLPEKRLVSRQLATGLRLIERLGATIDERTATKMLAALVDQAVRSGAQKIRIRTAGTNMTARLAFLHDGEPFSEPAVQQVLYSDGSPTLGSITLGTAASLYNEITSWTSNAALDCWVLTLTSGTDTWSLHRARKNPPSGVVADDETGSWTTMLFRAPLPQVAQADMTAILDRCTRELGVIFGDLLSGTSIDVNGSKVTSHDPFLWNNPAGQHLGEEHVTAEGLSILVSPRVLPHPSSLRPGDAHSVGDPSEWQSTQGFYVRCEGRFLSCGGWLGIGGLDMSSDTSLARVLVELPVDQLGAWEGSEPGAYLVPPEPLRPRLTALARMARNKSALVIEQHQTGVAT
ncbi:sigma-70 family RNA polymerase sigma factor [Nocardia africana]|uniref:RNA polymerase sigma factor rpoD n=1 Tax=Nocardia africana TaxID=134964 RepID=A0A378X0Z6_9NOCA|nr:RNA polymerase sigma factor RpoD/SigA [Nocardia africana]MCC3311463.1 RNA polymerase sigma factor RpoD/SigA [Nocardia africana]SUA47276.1 RNA polymerase sigma factor rpoD [Nocardia africana]